jgi:transcriptional regulator with XRE-family HTH domain
MFIDLFIKFQSILFLIYTIRMINGRESQRKQIREFYGLTQVGMAAHLGIKPSSYSMFEGGKRTIQTLKLNRFMQLYTIQQSDGKPEAIITEQLEIQRIKCIEWIHAEIKDRRYLIMKLERALAKLNDTQARSLEVLRRKEALSQLPKLTPDTSSGNDIVAIAIQQQDITSSLHKTKLELALFVFNAEIEFLQNRLKEL